MIQGLVVLDIMQIHILYKQDDAIAWKTLESKQRKGKRGKKNTWSEVTSSGPCGRSLAKAEIAVGLLSPRQVPTHHGVLPLLKAPPSLPSAPQPLLNSVAELERRSGSC